MIVAEQVSDTRCRTGEGPLWHPEKASLYWMDIPNGHLFRYDPRNDGVERVFEGPVLGAATLQKDGTIALFGIHGGIWLWRETRLDVVTAIPEARGTRFNDALADPSGRVLSGTMPTPARPSVVYAIEPNGRYRVVLDGLGQSNGMALSADHRTLFHVDTRATLVRACAYEVETGDARAPRVLAQFASSDGVPDGAALDEEGCLWVAMWGGGSVLRLNPDGRVMDRARLPTPLVSSVAFGGGELSDLYITTAGGDERERNGPTAGSLFRASPGVRGVARYRSALRLERSEHEIR